MKSMNKIIRDTLSSNAYNYARNRFLLMPVYDTNGRTKMVNNITSLKQSICNGLFDILLPKIYPGRK